MEIGDYLRIAWRWAWLIVLGTAVAAGSTYMAVRGEPPVYQTSTTMMIGDVLESADPNYTDFYTVERLAETYGALITREPILRSTASALGFEGQWASLRGQVSVNLIEGTQLIEIAVTDTDPRRAKLIADEIATQLIATIENSRLEDTNRRFIEEQARSFPPKIAAAQAEIQALETQLAEAFSARDIQDIQNRVNSLEAQVADWQRTFAQYQLLLGEGSVNVLSVIEEASVPTVPISAGLVRQVLLAAAIGMALAIGTAILLEYLDDTVKTPDDIARVTGLTTVGAITRIEGKEQMEKLITARYPKSPISEAYRVMRTNLQFSSLDQPLRSLVVTSPQPTEGKSTTVANLGVVMAQAGKRVVLVDSDLRRPTLHKFFGVSNKEGLTTALLEEEPYLNGRLQATGVDNLSILTSGPLPPNPSELLGSGRMKRLIEQMQEEADIILFDTPPSLPVTDATVLATQTDGVLVVTDSGHTRRSAVRETVERLGKVGANTLGIALNRLKPGHGGYYYYYYYESRYGNGTKKRRRRGLRRSFPWLTGRSKDS